jgi:hypothetical protein
MWNEKRMADRICATCVLPASYPGIEFDDAGVCNFCRDQIIATTDPDVVLQAARECRELVERVRGTAEYDAVLCYSGGKDSTYTLKLAVERYGLHVLAFTMDHGFLSSSTAQSIRAVVGALSVDHVSFSPAPSVFAGIMRASYVADLYGRATSRRISAGCQSCISIVNNMALKLALEKNIPLIVAGFTLGQIPANGILYRNNYDFLRESRARSLGMLRDHAGERVLPYLTIDEQTIARVTDYPYTVNLLAAEPDLTEDKILREIRLLGWVPPQDVDGCSSNCRLNVLNNTVHERRFGYNPYVLELSSLIRSGQLTRRDALAKIADQPREAIGGLLEQMGLTVDDLGLPADQPADSTRVQSPGSPSR